MRVWELAAIAKVWVRDWEIYYVSEDPHKDRSTTMCMSGRAHLEVECVCEI